MLPPSQDITRRRLVWEALSELFLNAELDESDRRRIADTLFDSGYTDGELAETLYGELFPVCIWNLRSVAGEWTGFDADRIRHRNWDDRSPVRLSGSFALPAAGSETTS